MLQFLRRIFSSTSDSLKMVLIVRDDLRMGRGKVAAQCAHASILCYEQALNKNSQMLKRWTINGQPKIVLRVQSLREIEEIFEKARNANIVAAIVRDAGRTQLEAGTVTVVGLGPDTVNKIDNIAKHLKLL